MSIFEKWFGKNNNKQMETPEAVPVGESSVEAEKALEEDILPIKEAALAAKGSQKKYLDGLLKLEGKEFKEAVRLQEEGELLAKEVDNIDVKRPDVMKKLRNKAAMIIGVVSLSLMATQEANAGGWDSDKTQVATTTVREFFGWLGDLQRTKQKEIEKQRDIERERLRKERDIARERLRTKRDVGREAIREKRDVTREAIRSKNSKNIQYTRGGETVSVGIEGQENQMNQKIANLNREIELKKKQLELKKKQQELKRLNDEMNNIN